ncbi:C40 family peptidase [Sphaerisporangium fuscum]|uniref:C40 family peptidase n=1 Tax=Sphaerisporangium fuscum TaxID=2835868 RepID=UPI001BDD75FF|nr:NlpC/P60 family protein [Sphaerisporangium fuscum]
MQPRRTPGKSAGRHARSRERGARAWLGRAVSAPRSLTRRIALVTATLTAVTFGSPLMAATAEPKPNLNQLKKQVEQLYNDIESLTEQYNGQKEKLKQAQRSAELAKKTLARSQGDLEAKRRMAGLYAQDAYMTGGIDSSLALAMSGDPENYLDRAATTYTLQMQQGEEVAQITKAMDIAERAKASAKAREAEVTKIVADLSTQQDKIHKLIAKTEGSLFKQAAAKAGPGPATRIAIPIPGSGKAAEAAKWALTQQLRPYVWGAAGPRFFDCSGLVMWAYQKVGISLPHYTGDQWTAGTHISRKEDLRPGDLVFFYSDLHHVGIYIGGGLMVHAPHTGDVVRVAPLGNRPFAGGVRIAD